MCTSLPRFKLAYLSYSALLASLFLLTAWRAIESEVQNIQTPGVQFRSASSEVHASQPKIGYQQATDQSDYLTISKQEELLTFCRDIRKLELRSEGQRYLDLLFLSQAKDILHQSLRLYPYDQFERSFKKDLASGLILFKSSEKNRDQALTNYPARIDIQVFNRTASSQGNRQAINLSDRRRYEKQSQLDNNFGSFADCSQARMLQHGQIVTGTNIGDMSTTNLMDCRNNQFYDFVGVVWHRLIGTGDTIYVKGSSTGDYAEMHVYSGSCGALNCVEGVYGIQSGEKFIRVITDPEQTYFIMLANYNTAPNMNYQLKIDNCLGRHLVYSPPNNFDSTSVIMVKTHRSITANNLIGKGAIIIYQAGISDGGVNLNAGFEVAKQAVFEADAKACRLNFSGLAAPNNDLKVNPSSNLPSGFLNEKIGPLIKEETPVMAPVKASIRN